jgi:hypothetical protein
MRLAVLTFALTLAVVSPAFAKAASAPTLPADVATYQKHAQCFMFGQKRYEKTVYIKDADLIITYTFDGALTGQLAGKKTAAMPSTIDILVNGEWKHWDVSKENMGEAWKTFTQELDKAAGDNEPTPCK